MKYFFNELSVPEEGSDHEIITQIKQFIEVCRELKRIQFKILRADRSIYNIEINGRQLIDWLSGDHVVRQKMKALISKYPYIGNDDVVNESIGWQILKYEDHEGIGLRVAFVKKSLVVSFASSEEWKQPEIEVLHEYICEDSEEINTETVIIKNVSLIEHCQVHKPFAIEKLKTMPVPGGWHPKDKYLPRVSVSNEILDIESFYENIGSKGIADFLEKGKHVAELNFYEKNAELTKINSSDDRIRHIYESRNIVGKKWYLSIDVEKGAFEVCDDKGTHQEEILFNEKHNGAQQLDHSIKLQN